ncbi:hypothetical protein LJC32_04635 [Oscillospiraceae bacterium OttesenSCG-928-F05]|nr:hypothetical protein [Oscillospiraceae bacterium OttesenSCG-928-F05]
MECEIALGRSGAIHLGLDKKNRLVYIVPKELAKRIPGRAKAFGTTDQKGQLRLPHDLLGILFCELPDEFENYPEANKERHIRWLAVGYPEYAARANRFVLRKYLGMSCEHVHCTRADCVHWTYNRCDHPVVYLNKRGRCKSYAKKLDWSMVCSEPVIPSKEYLKLYRTPEPSSLPFIMRVKKWIMRRNMRAAKRYEEQVESLIELLESYENRPLHRE